LTHTWCHTYKPAFTDSTDGNHLKLAWCYIHTDDASAALQLLSTIAQGLAQANNSNTELFTAFLQIRNQKSDDHRKVTKVCCAQHL